MKKLRSLVFLVLPLLLCLAGCGNTGKINEGDCAGTVSMINLPKEFSLLDENLQKEYQVNVTLKNLTTEKRYYVTLNQKNEFKQNVSLHPGKYSVSVYTTGDYLINLPVKVSTDDIATFDRGLETLIQVEPENVEAFTAHWMETHPEAEILSADKFSGLIQVNRKVMPIKDILTELDLSDMENTLEPSEKVMFSDNERGVTVVLQNQSGTAMPLSKCDLLSITVTKNTVIFPDGVSLGTAPAKICHKQTGLYGEPTRIEGMFLFGWGIAKTKAIYLDPISGDRITIEISPDGDSVESITYDLKVFE